MMSIVSAKMSTPVPYFLFLRKSRLHDVRREFNGIMERITAFLKPIVLSIKNKPSMDKSWDAGEGLWKK